MPKNQEDIEHTEGYGGHGEEIDGDDLADMVFQEGPPSLRWWFGLLDHVLGDGRFCDIVPQQGQL